MHAVSPTQRPADISVPVSTIAPPMPSAIGSFAAVSEMMLMIDERDRNAGTRIAMYTIAINMIMYMALLKSISVMTRRRSAGDLALKSSIQTDRRFFLFVEVSADILVFSSVHAYCAASVIMSSWVAVFASTSPASRPPDITSIRSHTPRSSGISDETIMTVLPLAARSMIS